MEFFKKVRLFYRKSKDSKAFFATLCMVSASLYFTAQLFLGQNSISKKRSLLIAQKEKERTLRLLTQKNMIQQSEIDLISENALDIDYLDEVARKKLNYSFKGEMVVIY